MKKLSLLLLLFLILPSAFADITITTDQPVYNLGNKARPSASILLDRNFEGLFRMTIICTDYSLQYFTTPVSLEADSRTALDVPELTLSPQMLGSCTLAGELATNDNLQAEQKQTNSFEITNKLNVLPVSSKIMAAPGDLIQIAGVVNEAFGNNVLKAMIKISLDNNTYAAEAADGRFSYPILLPKNIKSGKHAIGIGASDSKNNLGESSIELEVTPIPSYIKTDFSQYNIPPGTRINITSSLYDQADDLIKSNLNLEMVSPKKNKVFEKIVESSQNIDFEFSQYAEPGTYALTAAYKNIIAQSFINISTVREAKIKYGNEAVYIENEGNVPFVDQLTFYLQSQLKKYEITRKISIEPGKSTSIDLSKEVPSGIYDILFPLKEGIEPIREKINETIGSLFAENKEILAEETEIHDNRPVYRKIASGFESISARLVGADGVLTKNPLIAPSILVVIVLLVAFKYGRKPLMGLIKGRKKEPENKEKEK